MSDQPDIKKPLPGREDPGKAHVDKAGTPAVAKTETTATQSWQLELDKIRTPGAVVAKVTPHTNLGESTHVGIVEASAKPAAATVQPGAAPKVEAKPAEVKPVATTPPPAQEGFGTRAWNFVTNIPSNISAYRKEHELNINSQITNHSGGAGDFSNIAMGFSVLDIAQNRDKVGLATLGGMIVGATVLHRFGGGALEKLGLDAAKGTEAERGLTKEIFGGERALVKGSAEARAVTSEVSSFNAQLDAARTASLEFGPAAKITAGSTTDGLAVSRVRLHSAPIMETPRIPSTRPGTNPGSLNTLGFQIPEPMPRIPSGLKTAETVTTPRAVFEPPTTTAKPLLAKTEGVLDPTAHLTVPKELPHVPAAPPQVHVAETFKPAVIEPVGPRAGETAALVKGKPAIGSPEGPPVVVHEPVTVHAPEKAPVIEPAGTHVEAGPAPRVIQPVKAVEPVKLAERPKIVDPPNTVAPPKVVETSGRPALVEPPPRALDPAGRPIETPRVTEPVSKTASTEVVPGPKPVVVEQPGITPGKPGLEPIREPVKNPLIQQTKTPSGETVTVNSGPRPVVEGAPPPVVEARPVVAAPEVTLNKPVAQLAAEGQTVARTTVTEVKALQASATLSAKGKEAAKAIETNLERLSADGAETMSLTARKQAMTEIESGLKDLRTEVQNGSASAKASLTSIEDGVTKLRTTNDAILTRASETSAANITQDIRASVQQLNSADRVAAESVNRSLDRIASPNLTPAARTAAIEDLTANLEKMRPTSDAKAFAALESKVAELRAVNTAAEAVKIQETFEVSAKNITEAVRTARTTVGETGPAAEALTRLEANSNMLAVESRVATTIERKAAMEQMEADIQLLKTSKAADAVPQMERELTAMRASENSLNVVRSEAALAEAAPKFSQNIEQVLAKPGLLEGQRAELETLRVNAAKLEPSAYRALTAEQQALALREAETNVASLERTMGEDAVKLRQSLNEAKATAEEVSNARKLVASEDSASVKLSAELKADVTTPRVTPEVPAEPAPTVREKVSVQERITDPAAPESGKPRETETVKATEPLKPDPVKPADESIRQTETVRPVAETVRPAEPGTPSELAKPRPATESDPLVVKSLDLQPAAVQRAELVQQAAVKIEQDAAAINKSIQLADQANAAGRLGGDAAKTEQVLTAMRQEMAEAAAAGRSPNLDALRAHAAELPPAAAEALAARVEGLSTSIATREQMLTLDASLKDMSVKAQGLASQLAQLNVPSMSATIAELQSGAIGLTDARDKAAVLRSLTESLSSLSPTLEPAVADKLAATLDQLRQTNAAANAALADLVSSQLKRAADLNEAKDALKVLGTVVPEGTLTAQMVSAASDKLAAVEKARETAQALEAHQSIFLTPRLDGSFPGSVRGLESPGAQLFQIYQKGLLAEAASTPRSFAAVEAAMLATGAAYVYINGGSMLGTISAQRDAAASRTGDNTPTITSAPQVAPASPSVSNQAAFAAKTEAALSPTVQAALELERLKKNPTLSTSWDRTNDAFGFYVQAFSPEAVVDPVAPVFTAPTRKWNLSTSTSAPDANRRRLVYPGFAEDELRKKNNARRFGGLKPEFADNLSGLRTFGPTMNNTAGTSRIPSGLSRLMAREKVMHGLDTNGAGNATPTNNQPISIASTEPDNGQLSTTAGTASPVSQQAAPSVLPTRNKTVAV